MRDINKRIIKVADAYGLNRPIDFARKIGISHQVASNYLKGGQSPSAEALAKIQLSLDDLNAEWLLTGRGEMLKSETSETTSEKSASSLESLQCKIKLLKQNLADKDHIINLLTARIKELENKQNPSS